MGKVSKDIDTGKIERFIEGLQGMLLKMQEIDNRCLQTSKDISKREFVLVVLIGKMGEMIMSEIADYLQIPMSTATGVVDKLVEKDYVERRFSQEDRRIIKIGLSKAGKNVFNLMSESMMVFGKSTLCKFSDEEQENFINYLNIASK
jgi:DNA-binding MarR family transcriptional regulator